MKSRLPLLMPLILGGILAGLLLLVLPRDWTAGWNLWSNRFTAPPGEPPKPSQTPPPAKAEADQGFDFNLARQWADAADRIMAMLKRRLEVDGARKNEALLSFKSEQAYRDFLARAAAAGLRVLDKLDGFHMVRVGYDDLGALQKDLLAHAAEYGDVGANYLAYIPETPAKEDRAAQNEMPFGDNMLPFLGIKDNQNWGRGVTIAILDSGVAPNSTFGNGRLRYLDIGMGKLGTAEDGHGTAVAALALGEDADARGIAPGAQALSIRVTGADGMSDLFTLAKGITAAVDEGAQVINISLGAYQNSSVLTRAIDYAVKAGALVVAPSGNDQAAVMTWPAADTRVVSVGAVDALEQQATFSNSGQGLKITAPGYGINTAWSDGSRVVFDGTSGSSPIVAGAVAAMMSQNPGMGANEAFLVLQQYSNDGGAPGADSAYGTGILNVGWAMDWANPTRVDTAVSSHYYNNNSGTMEFVVQNRSGLAVSGLQLNVTDSMGQSAWTIPPLAAGATTTVSLPVNQLELQRADSGIRFRSQLVNPATMTDIVPSNNQKASTISKR
jgi:hypothetical protein